MKRGSICFVLLGLFLIGIVLPFQNDGRATSQPATVLPEGVDLPLTTYSLGWWAGNGRHDSSDQTYQKFLLPLAMRNELRIAIGWDNNANTSRNNIPCSSTVTEVLKQNDKYGIPSYFLFHVHDYGDFVGWAQQVVDARPELQTYDKTGSPTENLETPYVGVRVDHNSFGDQIYDDLSNIYGCYGDYISWVGFGQDAFSDHGQYTVDATSSVRGVKMLGNESIKNWYNSPFHRMTGNDSATYSSKGNPLVSTESVWKNIVAFHDSEYNAFVQWNYYNQIQRAINKLYEETGRQIFYFLNANDLQFLSSYVNIGNLTSFYDVYNPGGIETIANRYDTLNAVEQVEPRSYDAGYRIWGWLGQACCNTMIKSEDTWDWMFMMAFWGGKPMEMGLDANGKFGIYNQSSPAYEQLLKYGTILNRMRNVGSFYGSDVPDAPIVLYLGNGGTQIQFLTAALNVTINDPSKDYSAEYLRQFDVIILENQNSPSATGARAISNYVRNGGGLVIASTLGTGSSSWLRTWNASWANTFGFWAVNKGYGTYAGTSSVVDSNSPLLRPYGNTIIQGGYKPKYSGCCDASAAFTRMPNATATVVVSSSNLGPQVWINQYYNGRAVFLPWPDIQNTYYHGKSSNDAYWILLINSVFVAAGRESETPVLWHPEFKTATQTKLWSDQTFYSILGSPGEPLLVWFFTNSTSADNINLHLKASFYGIDESGWVAINALDWRILAQGSGNDIGLDVTVPAKMWLPVYILNRTTNLQPLYSNIELSSSSLTSNSGTYTLRGPHLFSSWLVVESSTPPSLVSSSLTGMIPEYSTLSALNKTIIGMHWTGSIWQNLTQTGWYYDSSNKLLYVHFVGDNTVGVTVEQAPSNNNGSVTIDPNGGRIFVDDVPITTTTSYLWQIGSSHLLYPDSSYSPASGTKVIFSRWNDGYTSEPRTVTVSSNISYSVQWTRQYFLTVNSPFGSPSGSGWYSEGSSASFSIRTPDDQGNLTRRIFVQWSGDSSSTSATSQTVMNRPKQVTAVWKTQYYLAVNTLPSLVFPVTESGWYDSGLSIILSGRNVVDLSSGSRYNLKLITLDGTTTSLVRSSTGSQSIILSSSSPHTVTWNYAVQYLIGVSSSVNGASVMINPSKGPLGDSYFDSGSSITFSVTTPYSVGTAERYTFDSWSGLMTSTVNSKSYTVSGSGNVQANWDREFYLSVDTPYGSSTGSGWYISGSTASFAVSSPYDQGNGTRRVFLNWSGDSTVKTPSSNVIMDAPRVINAIWQTQYELTIMTAAGGLTFPEAGTYWYPKGSYVTVTQSPQDEFTFSYWQLDGIETNTQTTYTIIMDHQHTLNVVFQSTFQPTRTTTTTVPVATTTTTQPSQTTTTTTVPVATTTTTQPSETASINSDIPEGSKTSQYLVVANDTRPSDEQTSVVMGLFSSMRVFFDFVSNNFLGVFIYTGIVVSTIVLRVKRQSLRGSFKRIRKFDGSMLRSYYYVGESQIHARRARLLNTYMDSTRDLQ